MARSDISDGSELKGQMGQVGKVLNAVQFAIGDRRALKIQYLQLSQAAQMLEPRLSFPILFGPLRHDVSKIRESLQRFEFRPVRWAEKDPKLCDIRPVPDFTEEFGVGRFQITTDFRHTVEHPPAVCSQLLAEPGGPNTFTFDAASHAAVLRSLDKLDR